MLTRPRWTAPSLVMALLATALWFAVPAAADEVADPEDCTFSAISGQSTCTTGGSPGDPGSTGDPGAGTTAEPTCDLSSRPVSQYDTDVTALFCIGTEPCFTANVLPPFALPKGKKPNEDSVGRITKCYTSAGTLRANLAFWSDDEEPEPPSLAEQARTAIGQIDLGTPDVGISPQNRTLVNLDTWFWVDGVTAEAQGSSAFGLVAVALDPTLTVDPGDGSAVMTCPLVTTSTEAEDSCAHTYRRASTHGTASVQGRPAYDVDVQVVYRLEFRLNGTLVDNIPGAPPNLSAGGDATPLRVDEIQSRVTGLR